MPSHQLAIAKASFSAGLLRPDPTSLPRESIEHFHSLLNSVVLQCTPGNVQKCKQWILQNISQSTARFAALVKYLTALTSSFSQSGGPSNAPTKREPSTKRKRLHLLYLLNDILYHSKYRGNDASICGKVQPVCMSLFASAASFQRCPKHQRKIQELLDIWEEKGYYSRDYIDKLRESVKNASEAGEYTDTSNGSTEKDQGNTAKAAKSIPYVMPATHGDPSTPWFDLPAGNLMPHIVPNSTRPINPDMIKPLQLVAGPADEGLALAVKALLDDVQIIYGGETEQDERGPMDIDELGQPIILDEITGDVLEGEGYYGWSRSFCEKMKRRKRGEKPGNDDGRGQRSESRSLSPGVRKRRYSDSDGSDNHRSPRRRRSYSSSRSPTPDRSRRNGHSGPGSRSRSRSRPSRPSSGSPHPPQPYPQQYSSRNQPPPPPAAPRNDFPPRPPMPNIPPPFQQGFNPNFPPPPPPPIQHNVPYSGQGQQYGAWPPPPPMMQNMPNMQYNPQNPQMGSWPPPPPPPPPGNPPGNFQQQQGQYLPTGPGGWQQQQQGGGGRGYHNNNNGWNGNFRGSRGGYRGGRGW
ncbi:hypothetical protein BDZ45DRAFT_588454 [Acephala macrosclerotiorum]|nr:hypothetical protein BDZ45DRAFT_588454 [Acephala macrosclerotiorum]